VHRLGTVGAHVRLSVASVVKTLLNY
jgi:hypothetical protein